MKTIVFSLLFAALLLPFAGCGGQQAQQEQQSDTSTENEPTPPIVGASSAYSCSVSQGFNFQTDAQVLVGYLNYLKVGDTVLQNDFTVTDPLSNQNSLQAAGVLSSVFWNGGYADPIQFAAQVSVTNRSALANLSHTDLSQTTVEFQFTVYRYDLNAKTYYKAFHSGSVLYGKMYSSGGNPVFKINLDQSMEVNYPKNYTLAMGVLPQNLTQAILVGSSSTSQTSKRWGSSASQ